MLFNLLNKTGYDLEPHPHLLIPIDDAVIVNTLIGEIARLIGTEPGEGGLMIADYFTAQNGEDIQIPFSEASSIYIIGECPEEWRDDPRVHQCDFSGELSSIDRFFIFYSSHMCFALISTHTIQPDNRTFSINGGWTGQRKHVRAIAEQVLEIAQFEKPAFPEPDPDAETHDFCHASVITRFFTEYLTTRYQAEITDRKDVYSVLEILQAISSRRSVHDVLYVFVEQIAEIIEVYRCSVVRVWSGSTEGHVVASHDDERISGLTISLQKYPEIRHALKTQGKVVINHVRNDPLTRDCANELQAAGICSLAVIPIVLNDTTVGSLLLRIAHNKRPFTPREIGFCEIVAEAASNALERAHLFENIQQANRQLERLAVTDGLTKLYNHRYFQDHIQNEYDRAMRYRLPLALLILDIDNFKKINDQFGHLQGDVILRELARRLEKSIRKSDFAARYGGEEFTVVMPQTDLQGALAEAQRLLYELSHPEFPGMPPGYSVTVSIGVAELIHDKMTSPEMLIKVADDGLYEAKRKGKNRVIAGTFKGEK